MDISTPLCLKTDFLIHLNSMKTGCKRIEVNQSWYRYVPQARERRAAKRHVVGFNECATLNKLQVTGLLIEMNMLIIS